MAEFVGETTAYESDEENGPGLGMKEPDLGRGLLPLINREYFYDLLMEQQEQM